MVDMKMDALTLPEIRDVYRHQLIRDFPEDEVKPLARIERALKRGEYCCFGIRDGKDILAYAFFVAAADGYLFDYFAVREDLRGTGIGSAFLKELGNRYLRNASCVLLEVDDPDSAESGEERAACERRIRFYLKNGMRDTGARARTFGVDYRILEYPAGEVHSREEAGEIYSRIYRSFLPESLFRRNVKICDE